MAEWWWTPLANRNFDHITEQMIQNECDQSSCGIWSVAISIRTYANILSEIPSKSCLPEQPKVRHGSIFLPATNWKLIKWHSETNLRCFQSNGMWFSWSAVDLNLVPVERLTNALAWYWRHKWIKIDNFLRATASNCIFCIALIHISVNEHLIGCNVYTSKK